MKNKKRFVCKECGYNSVTWIGKCPECLSWNSFIEEVIEFEKKSGIDESNKKNKIKNIADIEYSNNIIIKTTNEKVNLFFNEGITSGSVNLISGEPGIGKSTLLLFFSGILNNKIFYFSGEESIPQIKTRYDRIKINSNLFISNETEIDSIIDICKKNTPEIIFIDSIQTVFFHEIDSLRGSISQIKYCTNALIDYAKEHSVPIFIISHITKTGDIAGPKLLEHMVDMVIYFEGDYEHNYRILRSTKNRFGSTDEILIFEIKEKGLILIENPSSYFIEEEEEKKSFMGKCRTIIIQGKIPIILEVEALVVPSGFSNPRRFSEGVDIARLNRIAAILDKYTNENLNNYDIYFNISGGIKTRDVGIDLAMAIAIYSSKNKKEIDKNNIFIGELSLTGKIRTVQKLEQRVKEAISFASKKIILPHNKMFFNDSSFINVDDINTAIKLIFK